VVRADDRPSSPLRDPRLTCLPNGDADARPQDVGYDVTTLPTGLHPLLTRLRGFPGSSTPIRRVEGRTHASLALLDRLGTVPALVIDGQRVQRNHEIARYLDRRDADRPLFPPEPDRRAAVEEAERWGDEILQMAARRASLAVASSGGLDALHRRGGEGRLGSLLAANDRMRELSARTAGVVFRAGREAASTREIDLAAMFDEVDALIGDGVIGGEQPNVADFVIAPSLALLSYSEPSRSLLAGRPAGLLMDRLLPEPA
jgi:glutathione S-transferase